ncbi:sodium/proton antiporter, NhaA family (TC 2.A.33.1.1) [Stackebrandtia albiflava]|uniref:Na(+)/H(+) antiporter NhaA n=1 Tax=Stackebrandtia albiflava TaxID=406432 RepID=A0A562V9P7_9ACTN|nr:Na+/H+ antiporter NhaA [Stackebrandtia albiflava]TWJ14568.1 sodium/proton antiporter, NhaA family (TC 2.A.33.1.1) [Stackebrandtia albiflava]
MNALHRFADALRRDTVGGLLLIAAAVVALAWANSPWASAYESVRTFTIGPESLHLNLSLETWAADGLLALFFYIVGNELKQEFIYGELRDPRRAMVPVIAAVCGAAVPAAIFALVNLGRPEAMSGWGIPMATDVAFAVAVLALVGKHLPPALRTFLLTLAVVDDLVAIVVIAVFYTASIAVTPLLAALVLLAVFGYLQHARFLDGRRAARWCVFAPMAVVIWVLVHESGIHATIAGVAMGLLMRTSRRRGETVDPSHRMENLLRPWTMGLALPIFALLSAGVVFEGFASTVTDTIAVGVMAGLVLGKLVGIAGGAWLTTKLTTGHIDPSLSWWDIVGMSQLAGIGFTVSLLISELSYAGDDRMLEHAKAGVLLGSVLAVALATVLLSARNRHYRRLATTTG